MRTYDRRITRNAVQCHKCDEIVESTHRHDFKFCKCRNIAVDGGHDYLRRMGGLQSFKEMSTFEPEDERQ